MEIHLTAKQAMLMGVLGVQQAATSQLVVGAIEMMIRRVGVVLAGQRNDMVFGSRWGLN
jgi:hypothetical protein